MLIFKKAEDNPTAKWRVAQLKTWLGEHGVEYPPKAKKPELLKLAKEKAKEFKKYTLEAIVEEEGRGIKILRLPPYHCRFTDYRYAVWKFQEFFCHTDFT